MSVPHLQSLFLFITLLISQSLFGSSEHFVPNCPMQTETQDDVIVSQTHSISLFGQKRPYTQIISRRLQRSRRVRARLFSKGEAVFVGFSQNGHIYVVAGDRRYDPDFFFRRNGISSKALLSRGLVVRISHSHHNLSQHMGSYIPKDDHLPHVFNCVEGTCRLLNAGLLSSLELKPKTTLYPQSLLRHLLQLPQQEGAGELQVDLLFLGEGELRIYLKKMKRRTYLYTSLPFLALAISHYLRVEILDLTLGWGPF